MEQAIDLAKQSDSTIIILLVLLALLVILLTPSIKVLAKIQDKKVSETYKREDRFIQVIEKNTEVNAALKTLIEADQKHCDECKKEQRDLFRKLFDNQEMSNIKLAEISQKLESSAD